MLKKLKQEVYRINMALVEAGLVILTWGNASGADRTRGLMAIKPSGVDYDKLQPSDIVVLSLETGEVVEGDLRPSSDTPTHLELYRRFPTVGGIIHTHSTHATSFAQACREIPCLGTTHADNFYGAIPLTRPLSAEEIQSEYELNTGRVIVEHFEKNNLTPEERPGVLVSSHGPFAWGPTPQKSYENAVLMEAAAQMALCTFQLNPQVPPIPQVLLDKHYLRKHGDKAYYGQK